MIFSKKASLSSLELPSDSTPAYNKVGALSYVNVFLILFAGLSPAYSAAPAPSRDIMNTKSLSARRRPDHNNNRERAALVFSRGSNWIGLKHN